MPPLGPKRLDARTGSRHPSTNATVSAAESTELTKRSWGVQARLLASVSMPAPDAEYGELRGPDGLELAIGGHKDLGDIFRTFARVRMVRQVELARSFDSPPTDISLRLAGINAGLRARHQDLPSGINLSGSISVGLPRPSFSARIGEVFSLMAGAAVDKTFGSVGYGTLQLRLSAHYRFSFGDSEVRGYNQYRPSLGFRLNEANSVWSTGTLTYRMGESLVLSAGAVIAYFQTNTKQTYPNQAPLRGYGGNFLYGAEVGYEITTHLKVALGLSRLGLGYHQESSLGPLDFPFFLDDAFGWVSSRVYFATCLSY